MTVEELIKESERSLMVAFEKADEISEYNCSIISLRQKNTAGMHPAVFFRFYL